MKSIIFGESVSGLPIPAYQFGQSGPKVLILGGVHGDEVEGVIAAYGLLKSFAKAYSFQLQLTLIPMFNIDGVLAKQRQNARGVDLNRNLPTNDWTSDVAEKRYWPGPHANSEPENQALVELLEIQRPHFVLSLHSWKPLLNVNGNCLSQAQIIHKYTNYTIDEHIGYPTPGCLGTYCGLEREMPTLTYEIERGLSSDKILQVHVPAILESLKVCERPNEH
jgi:protein MpaA